MHSPSVMLGLRNLRKIYQRDPTTPVIVEIKEVNETVQGMVVRFEDDVLGLYLPARGETLTVAAERLSTLHVRSTINPTEQIRNSRERIEAFIQLAASEAVIFPFLRYAGATLYITGRGRFVETDGTVRLTGVVAHSESGGETIIPLAAIETDLLDRENFTKEKGVDQRYQNFLDKVNEFYGHRCPFRVNDVVYEQPHGEMSDKLSGRKYYIVHEVYRKPQDMDGVFCDMALLDLNGQIPVLKYVFSSTYRLREN